MDIIPTSIAGVFLIKGKLLHDQRGYFLKTFHADTFSAYGLNITWREQYWSSSHRGVIRGMHFQTPPVDHAKLISCIVGSVQDVIVDLRKASPTFGTYISIELNSNAGESLYIPRGMAHGFLALGQQSVMQYNVETTHSPAQDSGVRWDSCGIEWQLDGPPTLSPRDLAFSSFHDLNSPF